MINLQSTKRVLLVAPASLTNGATIAGYVDTLGHDYLTVEVHASSAAATELMATLRILEYDGTQPTAATNYATITGFVSGTDYTIPAPYTAATSVTNPLAVFYVNTARRKRYIRCEVSPVTTQIISIGAQLSRSEQSPAVTSQGKVTCVG